MNYQELISKTYQTIAPYIRKTPVFESSYFSQLVGSPVFFKCENLQYTNSFKVRGAFNKLTKIKNKKNKIAIACSGGNHGLAVTYAAKQFGMKSVIIVPDFVPQYRIDNIKALGAEVIVCGKTIDDANAKATEFTEDANYVYVHPFDDDEVIAGQATIAYELLEDFPDIEVIIAAIGGGGLISGLSQYAKACNPRMKIYGAQTIGANAMEKSIEANKIVAIPGVTSIATSLGATKVSERTFNIVRKNVEKVVAVTDTEALVDLKAVLDKEKLLIEPATSCTLSALRLKIIEEIKGKKIAIILCGGNFSLAQLKSYL